MQTLRAARPVLIALLVVLGSRAQTPHSTLATGTLAGKTHEKRLFPWDLEIGGDLAGLPKGTTRYLTRDDLLAMPQVKYTVTDDSNFRGSVEVSGVFLDDLLRNFSAAPDSDLVIAVCSDLYRTNYPRAYRAAHHPLLVLKLNGVSPEHWPKSTDTHGGTMGPFMISHPSFAPTFKVLAHEDEPQIPWGVVRLEFRDEKSVFGAIAPPSGQASDSTVQAGYQIAQQNCFRCHNMGEEGGQKARRSWSVLGAIAATAPEHFAGYVRNPLAINPSSQMPPSPTYDEATLRALVAYFRTFSREKP